MNTSQWYQNLIRPDWAPPAALFGPVWAVLYTLIFFSFGYVAWLLYKKRISHKTALPFGINIIANLLFSPIQFQLQNNLLASIDILIVLGSLIWGMIVIYKHARVVTFVNIPYLLWVAFATVLQLTITVLNW